MDCLKIKIEFTAYMKPVVQNSATDYKRKVLKRLEREVCVADFVTVSKEPASVDSGSFSLEKDITYLNIEDLFSNARYYSAMKGLSDKEKMVLLLTVVEEKDTVQVAEMMNVSNENVWQIKSRAVKNFLKRLKNEDLQV